MHTLKVTTFQLNWMHEKLKLDQAAVNQAVADFLRQAEIAWNGCQLNAPLLDAIKRPLDVEKCLEEKMLGEEWARAWRRVREMRSMVLVWLKAIKDEVKVEEQEDRVATRRGKQMLVG